MDITYVNSTLNDIYPPQIYTFTNLLCSRKFQSYILSNNKINYVCIQNDENLSKSRKENKYHVLSNSISNIMYITLLYCTLMCLYYIVNETLFKHTKVLIDYLSLQIFCFHVIVSMVLNYPCRNINIFCNFV